MCSLSYYQQASWRKDTSAIVTATAEVYKARLAFGGRRTTGLEEVHVNLRGLGRSPGRGGSFEGRHEIGGLRMSGETVGCEYDLLFVAAVVVLFGSTGIFSFVYSFVNSLID